MSAEFEAAVLERVRKEFCHSPEDLLAMALHILTWAQNHPDGKREVLRYKLQAGIDDAEAGNLFDADEVLRELKNRRRGEDS